MATNEEAARKSLPLGTLGTDAGAFALFRIGFSVNSGTTGKSWPSLLGVSDKPLSTDSSQNEPLGAARASARG